MKESSNSSHGDDELAEDDLRYLLKGFLVKTHSPLVMASAAPLFDTHRDTIFHLDLLRHGPSRDEVILEEPEFVRYGSANSWLMSDIFKLDRPYSVGAEKILEDAKKLQLKEKPTQLPEEETPVHCLRA